MEGVSRNWPSWAGLVGADAKRAASCVYAARCDEAAAPIVPAFEKGERFAELFPNAHTVASGLRVPVGGRRLHDARRHPRQRRQGRRRAAKRRSSSGCGGASSAEGISICPETAVCFDVLERMVAAGDVQADETVVVFNTGAAPKYLEALPVDLPAIDKDRVDWEAVATQ